MDRTIGQKPGLPAELTRSEVHGIHGQDGSRLLIQFEERDTRGDFRADVSGHCGGFSGKGDVWISSATWERFNSELSRLNSERQRDASLSRSEAGGLTIRIFSTSRGGNLALEGDLTQYVYAGRLPKTLKVSFAFQLDPELFEQIIADFKRVTERVQH